MRGLYFLRLKDSFYVGKSDEFHVRLTGHKGKKPLWWVFISPEQSIQTFPKDALDAAESLLISFWNETSILENGTRGGDQKPAFTYLQQAVLMVEATSAVILWLIREKADFGFTRVDYPVQEMAG